nr:unnamed protein product [Spirometra erinaceieuropaei]
MRWTQTTAVLDSGDEVVCVHPTSMDKSPVSPAKPVKSPNIVFAARNHHFVDLDLDVGSTELTDLLQEGLCAQVSPLHCGLVNYANCGCTSDDPSAFNESKAGFHRLRQCQVPPLKH